MTRPPRRLAHLAGLAAPHPGTRAARRTLNAAGTGGPWYPPTVPGEFTGEQAALTDGLLAQLELHHEDQAPRAAPPRTWAQAAALDAWRRQMNAWLDHEWLAWRDLLATYPAPGGGA